jgi:hypothetical protein
MSKPLDNVLNWIAGNFRKDASKMLIWTGVAGWTLSSLAQAGAVLFNPKISPDQKSFLVPQELADAAVNIGAFFLVTQATKKTVSKLYSTGKFAPKSVRAFLEKNKDLYGKKVGKLDFDLDEVLKSSKNGEFPTKEYYTCKNFGTSLATVGAGVVSSNIITPILRNRMAANMQKNYLEKKQQYTNMQISKPSSSMRV